MGERSSIVMPMTPENEVRLRRRQEFLWIAAGVVLLVAVRTLQLRTLAPLLYSPEFAQFANLAADLASGRDVWPGSVSDFYAFYAYGDHAQGTLLISLLAVPASLLFGPTTIALHAVGLGFEALLLVLAAHLGFGLGRGRGALAAISLIVFPPFFAVAFQSMPYGNHTEFLAVPWLLALAASRTPGAHLRRLIGLTCVVAAGFFLYRLNLAAVLAFGVVVLLEGSPSVRVRSIAVVLLGLGVGFLATLLARSGAGDVTDVALPALSADPQAILGGIERLARSSWPAAPRGAPGLQSVARLLSLGSVLLCAGVALGDAGPLRRVARFAVVWAALGAAAPVISGQAKPEYLLQAFYASLLALTVAGLSPKRPVHLAAGLCGALLLAFGIADGLRAISPSTWSQTPYDGARLARELRLDSLDIDELPFWNRIVDEGRAAKDMGLVTRLGDCRQQFARRLDFALGGYDEDRCGARCADEPLARALESEMAANPALDRVSVGRALWVVCNRDLEQVEGVLSRLEPGDATGYREGALDEAGR